mgnify:CR=1 FL=1
MFFSVWTSLGWILAHLDEIKGKLFWFAKFKKCQFEITTSDKKLKKMPSLKVFGFEDRKSSSIFWKAASGEKNWLFFRHSYFMEKVILIVIAIDVDSWKEIHRESKFIYHFLITFFFESLNNLKFCMIYNLLL